MTDFRIERDNLINISELMKTGEKLQASHRFLQIANRHAEMIPLLDHTINVEEDDVPEHLKTVIYRILQEAFNNVAKHSRAGRVSIGLEKKDALLVFGISDDGIGFDPEKVVSLERSKRGVGLASMRERTELTGGHFFISSGRKTGTTIRIVWSLALGAQRVST